MRSSRALAAAPAERLRSSRGTQFSAQGVSTMMKKTRAAAIAALGLGVVLAAAACSSGGSSSASSGGGGGLVLQRPGHADLLDERHPRSRPHVLRRTPSSPFDAAHPGVTIKMQAIQNEDYDGKLQTALASNTAPDIFFQRGGGKMLAMVNANQVAPLTLTAADQANVSAAAARRRQLSTARSTASRSTRSPRAIYYSQDLFTAGGHHHDADHHPRARGRRRQAEGRRGRADRGRRQGRVARGPLVLQLRRCASAARPR